METVYEAYNLYATLNESFLTKEEADNIFKGCGELNWPAQYTHRRVNITFADKGLVYKVNFGGNDLVRTTVNWDEFDALLGIKRKLECTSGLSFNFCAIMRYETGDIIIKKHRDKEMGNNPIYGVSVGSTRMLQLSPPSYLKNKPIILNLNHGSLYTLHPPTNTTWVHEILPEENATTRYSLTFRRIIYVDNICKSPITYSTCKTILKTGVRKGEVCGCRVIDNAFTCKRHKLKV